ncbi:MAG: MMPL family transporter [Clostridiales bacterium]|nr:MMPL family transporter [Clostridiales bacterium]
MNRMFKRIGEQINKSPVKVLLATMLLFALLITGVTSIKMATGNETLVQSDNEVYLSNVEMENSFGGDSILILFTDSERVNLLSQENIQKMWNVEKKFEYEDNIFSFTSPASIIHQLTEKQSTELKKQMISLSDGLDEMSSKMIDLGNELGSKDIKDPDDILDKLNGISNSTEAFDKLITVQDSLNEGAEQMQMGLFSAADGLSTASGQLSELTNLAGDNIELKNKLTVISENIGVSSENIRTIGEKTTNIQSGTENTSKALTNINSNLTTEITSMKDGFSDGLSPYELKKMAEGFIVMGENLGDVSDGLKLFHTKSDMMIADIPKNQVELDNMLYENDDELRPIFSDVMIDDENCLMVVKLKGNLDDEYKDQISKDLTEALKEEEFETVSYVISGKPVLDSSLRTEMKTNMMIMVGFAILIMLTVLAVIFKVRWRMLSLGVILVSVIATVGLMGHLSVPITMVSMAVFPILIGLGIDYSIQFHNRYEEEKSVIKTVTQIGKAITIAVLATVLGFISLYASPVPMIQDFGKMLTIGVIISFVGSILLLMPILHLRDKSSPVKQLKAVDEKETKLNKILEFTTRKVIRFSIPIIIIVVTLASAGFIADKNVGVETDIETFMPQNMKALNDIHLVRDTVGSTDQVAIYLKDDFVLEEENLDWLKTKTKKIENEYKDIVIDAKSIDTLAENLSNNEDASYEEYINIIDGLPKQQANMFVNEEKTESVILLNIKHLPTEELKEFVSELENDIKDTDMKTEITGKSILDLEMVEGLTSGRIKMTIIGLLLVFTALFVIYRNPFKALIPIIPVVLIIGMSSGIMYLLGIDYTPITSTLGALILGMGTEMTVMLMERYLEERKLGENKLEAIITAVSKIGKAIVASGLTTVGGFSVLMASQFVILRDFGLMTVINISLALFSTFIVLPPIILLLDKFILRKKSITE